MSKTIKEELNKWAKRYFPKFLELSEKNNQNNFYTQSPLSELVDSPRLMIIGLNPYGGKQGERRKSPSDFLSGNPCWKSRFDENRRVSKEKGNDWSNYFERTRYFLGCSSPYEDPYIDDDEQVVWTNLTPFTALKFENLPKELASDDIYKSTLELIDILKPQKILLLGYGAFGLLESACKEDAKFSVEHVKDRKFSHVKVLDNANWPLEVGYIHDIPAVCVNHPSRQWPISNAFVPIFIFLHSIAIQKCTTLEGVRKYMRDEFKAWQKQMVFND
jgi:hypothetical protein